MRSKRFTYKVYTAAGVYVTSWGDVVERGSSPISFSTGIDNGAGACSLQLARTVQSFGEDSDVKLGNIVKIYSKYNGATTTSLIYQGKVMTYKKNIQGSTEVIDVTLVGLVHELQQIIYRNGSAETDNTTIAHASVDPGSVIADDIMDQYIVNGGNLTIGTISTVGVSRSYTFNTQTSLEALREAKKLAGDGWYFRVNPDGTVDFKEVSATADHLLYMGRGIASMMQENRMDNIINRVLFTGSSLYKVETRSTSITNYGLQEERVVDKRVSVGSTADILMTSLLDDKDSPQVRTVIRLMDQSIDSNGYDIESFKVGDTIKVKNVAKLPLSLWDISQLDVAKWDYAIASITETVQPIVKITYATDYIDIETSDKLPIVQARIEDVRRDLRLDQTQSNTTAPTT